ncbi:uncharacterized protein LOC125684330 [Lagopus muta]|uniref:uncharacterized protein LOC125684330 n=1 Tax=Lagopus muta TaxID=64668 RepID=UPI0020A06283|nr:uncharacterized protein LOC125684330 [Lagopus muta]
MLELEEYFSRQVEKMAQLQVLCPLLFLESSLLESRGAAGGLLCGCCGHFSQLRSLSPRWQRTCCATIFSVETLCSFSALAAVVPVSRCHKPDWHSLGTQTWETVKKPQGKCCSAEEGSPEGEQKEPRRPTGHESAGMLPRRWHQGQRTELPGFHRQCRGTEAPGREGLVLRSKQRGLARGRTSAMARDGDAAFLQHVSLQGQSQSSMRLKYGSPGLEREEVTWP